MVREIKFRFWLSHTKQMTYIHDISEIGKIIPVFTDDIQPLQYTGRLDKNGKEIYEGDVIARRGMENGYVEYNRGKWCIRKDERNVEWRTDLHNQLSIHIEVIGNIFQNPELLTP